ncbi:D,D-peptidase/D,D-carboxypeptidase VanY-N [Streptomyces sp. LARHCF252]
MRASGSRTRLQGEVNGASHCGRTVPGVYAGRAVCSAAARSARSSRPSLSSVRPLAGPRSADRAYPSLPHEASCPAEPCISSAYRKLDTGRQHRARSTGGMNESHIIPLRPRDRLFAVLAVVLAVLLLPVAFVRHPGRAREWACHWALGVRFPAENLTGLTYGARAAFTAARAEALWRHGQLIGLTSGYRDPLVQQRLFDEEVSRVGSPAAARMLVLPPAESKHVKGTALDVRPYEGARWLEEHGARYGLHRIYDNEWWHFEYRPDAGLQATEGIGNALPNPQAASTC